MKTFLLALTLMSSSFAQAITLNHFTIHRDGAGQLAALITESPEGLRMSLLSCDFQTMPTGVEALIHGQKIIAEARMILRGKALILSDMSPINQMAESGSWSRLSYEMDMNQNFRDTDPHIPARLEVFDVKSPKIMINGQLSNVLEVLESQAQNLCQKVVLE